MAPKALAAGSSCKIGVAFTPGVLGALTGSVTVTDNASNSPQTVQLSGSGVSPVVLSTASLGFGNQVLNTTSAVKTVSLINYQTVPLTISGISASGNFTETTNCPTSPSTLGARSSCTISVTFTPTATGAQSGALTITDNASNSLQTAALTGTGVAPATLSLASIAFGNQFVNTTSTAKSISLTNYQTVPLTISEISASGNFAQTSTCPLSPSTLAAGSSCAISVTFTPIAIGAQTGTLTVNDTASNSPQSAQLTGTGVAPVILSASSLTFGSQVVGTASAAQQINLKNNQQAALAIGSISVSGNFAQTSTCPLSPNTLAAESTCTISVSFTPTAVGTQSGSLTIIDNASNSPQTVQLSGSGLTPAALSLASIAFGNQFVNTTSSAKSITLINHQAIPLTISGISASGAYAQTSTCPLSPNALAAGSSCAISVTFTPTAIGAQTGTLSITDNASNSPQTAALTGTGVAPATLSLASIAFGNQFVNTTSTAKSISLTNSQTVPLTISGISASGNFAQTSTCPLSPNTLAAGLSCTISVTFTPIAAGNLTGTLTVNDNASNSPQTVQLTGTGVAPVILSASSLTFASQVLGTASAVQKINLKNNQQVAMTVGSVTISGDFAQTSTCPLSPNTLAAGSSCTISVTFTPTTLGTRTGTLTITDNASTSPQAVSLSGTGSLTGLIAISVTPSNSSVPLGNQQQLIATGIWQNGYTLNISSFVTWLSSAPSVATVSSSGLAQAVGNSTTTITATYGSISGSTTVTVAPPTLTSITVTPSYPSVPTGAYEQFTAILNYSNGSTKDVTSSVTWSSATTTVATLTSSGLASGLAVGSTQVTGTLGGVTGTTTLSVSQPQCAVPPSGLVAWWTGDGNTVDIAGDNSGTLQDAATYGTGEVAQAFSFAGNGASVLVNSPVYSPTAGTLMFWFMPTGPGALTGSFDGVNRTPGFSMGSNGNLDWEFGNLSTQGVGQVSLNQWYFVVMTYASSGSDVTVNVYLNGNLAASAIASPLSSWYQQVAFGAYLGGQNPSFSGSMDEVAIFDQALSSQQIQQIYNAFSAGMCKPILESIAVTPANLSIAIGLSQQFDAAGTYSDGTTHDLTTSATWSSSNPPAATVNGSGQATAVGIGNTTIAAALGAETGSTNLTVVPSLVSLQVNPQNPSITVGATQPFTVTGTFSDGSTQNLTTSVSWSSSLPAVATITTIGLANGVDTGQATITAMAGSVSGSTLLTVTPATTAVLMSVTVNPTSPSILASSTQQFTATGTFSDNSTQDLTNAATWTSFNTSVAGITSTGLASGFTAGTTTISAAYQSVSGSTTLTVAVSSPVLQSISVTPANPSVAIGQNQQFVATGQYSDGSTQNLTGSVNWSSSQPAIAGISSTGLANGLGGGSTSIIATLGTINASATLNVNSLALVSIVVTPVNASIAPGTNQQLAAIGTYADCSTLDLTMSVTWSSSLPSVATVNVSGLAASVSTGQTMMTATAAGIFGSSTLTITSAALVSIAITPAIQTIPLGTTEQFVATGTFTDASVQNITGSLQWSSSNGPIATISNAPGTLGLATSMGTGASSISATSGSISASTTLAVSSVALVSITVNPPSPFIAPGTTQQFTATGTFTDGSTQDLTAQATWVSGNPAVATVSCSALGTSLSTGTVTISATLGGITGSTLLTVTSASVVSITVNPTTATIPVGLNQAFKAAGTFSDGSSQDVTDSAHWSSSVAGVATVSNTLGSNGLANGTGSGSTVISATLDGVSGSGSLTVTTAMLADIEISPQSPSIPTGSTEQFAATGVYTDGTTANITTIATWTSSSATVATISNTSGSQGLATSTGSGTTGVSVSMGSLTASTTLTVQDQLISIRVEPLSALIAPGADQQFTATGTYLSGITQNLTNTVLWNSSSNGVATITPTGLAMSVAAGQSTISATLGSLSSSSALAVTPIQHVVIVVQENRTPDNLFQDPNLIANGADIATVGINSFGQTIQLQPDHLDNAYDLGHGHSQFLTSYNNGNMNGFNLDPGECSPSPCTLPANPSYFTVYPTDVAPYFQLAEQYTFADRMFQTNQGPSFPAHQFVIAGTSAPTATSDLYASENPNPSGVGGGCGAPANALVPLIDPTGNESENQYPCFEHQTLSDLLDGAGISWRYYTADLNSIVSGPNAIQHIFTGPDWKNVIVPQTQVLTDIADGKLAGVSWVTPDGQQSDHPGANEGTGPSWVMSIVNAIGSSPYWANTAIFVTWDDWGGWYDHVAPSIYNSYEYGFRVPLIVVSPYAKPAYVSHVTHDFGSILSFIEDNYGLPSLGYADARADNLSDCFNFSQPAMVFQKIPAPFGPDYFLNDKRPPTAADND
jgi:phospholipase C